MRLRIGTLTNMYIRAWVYLYITGREWEAYKGDNAYWSKFYDLHINFKEYPHMNCILRYLCDLVDLVLY